MERGIRRPQQRSKHITLVFPWRPLSSVCVVCHRLSTCRGPIKHDTTLSTIRKEESWNFVPTTNMMTSSSGNIFRVTGPLCGEFIGPGEFPAQRPVTRCFDVFFDLRLNKRLSKQWWGWWFETPSWSLWRHTHKNTLWLVIGKSFGFTPLSFSNIYGLRITKP